MKNYQFHLKICAARNSGKHTYFSCIPDTVSKILLPDNFDFLENVFKKSPCTQKLIK